MYGGAAPVFFGTESIPSMALCQVPGEAVRVKAKEFREAVRGGGPLHDLLHRYAHYLLVLSSQSTACNRLHSAEERLCRWLLMTHDRVGGDQFPLTQEFMARMLGVRRPTVSLVASTLQRAGLIQYSRGKVMVLDRPGLESAACECYAVVKKELERLLG
jgi:CRP-like cAMP-binding protein